MDLLMMVIVIVVNELVIFARLTEISIKRLQHCFRIRSTQGPLGMTFVVQGEGLIIVLVPLLRQFARLRHLHRDIHIESSHCNHVSWVLIPFFPLSSNPHIASDRIDNMTEWGSRSFLFYRMSWYDCFCHTLPFNYVVDERIYSLVDCERPRAIMAAA